MTTTLSLEKMVLEEDFHFEIDSFHLTFEQRKWIISQRLDCHDVNSIIQKCPFERNAPSQQAIYKLIKKVKETGTVEEKSGRGRIPIIDTPENREIVIKYIEKYPQVSLKKISDELDLNKSFV